MKAILEFDLNDPDDNMAHKRCVKSLDMALALWEIQTNLRKRCENMVEHSKEESKFEALEIIFQELREIFDDNNINTDELIN